MPSMRTVLATLSMVGLALPATAQNPVDTGLQASLQVARLTAEPARITVVAGRTVPFKVVALDAAGNPVENAAIRVSAPRNTVRVTADGLTGINAGSYEVVATLILPPNSGREPAELRVPVTVTWPAAARVEIDAGSGTLYVGSTVRHNVRVFHADGSERPGAAAEWSSSDPAVAAIDRWGNVTALKAGTVTITATVDATSATIRHDTAPFPARSLQITTREERIRTGDVVHLTATATTQDGRTVTDVPVTWSYTFVPDDSIHASGAAGLIADGRFVAEVPGQYTILANAGPITTRKVIDVRPRDVVRNVQLMGQGQVNGVHTSDLWIFEGLDGRDYAVTGTWGADGYAYFWDVTDPASIVKTDSIRVDARTVNDVKVSPDGRYAALSREGASNRRNGVVILDLSDPAHPTIASVFDDGLTGGVHNMFATRD